MTHRIERGEGWELHAADWRDCDLPNVDAVIEDPPYGERTHAGQKTLAHEKRWAREGQSPDRRKADALAITGDIGYEHLTPKEAVHLVTSATDVCKGWALWMTSHDLIPEYERGATAAGRYCFVPIPIVMPGMNVRLAGDGPSNWTVYMMVTRTTAKKCWSTKPGAYVGHTGTDRRMSAVKGAKPLSLLEAILRDYTDPGDLVLDRFTGGGTTGVAAIRNGRRFVGYERKPEHFEIALKRLRAIRPQRDIFAEARAEPQPTKTADLFAEQDKPT